MGRAIEGILAAIAEFLGLEAAKLALGDVFPVAALTALVAFPIAAVLMDIVAGDRVSYGGFLYYLTGALFLALVWVPLIMLGLVIGG